MGVKPEDSIAFDFYLEASINIHGKSSGNCSVEQEVMGSSGNPFLPSPEDEIQRSAALTRLKQWPLSVYQHFCFPREYSHSVLINAVQRRLKANFLVLIFAFLVVTQTSLFPSSLSMKQNQVNEF